MELDRAIEICRDHIRIGKGMEPDVNLYDVPHALEMVVNEVEQYRADIADGRWVRLPCKVGTRIWFDDGTNGRILSYQVDGYETDKDGNLEARISDPPKGPEWVDIRCFGKTVFLTHAEAEAALAAQEVQR